MEKKINMRQVITILVTLITIILNILANALPFNNQGTGEISDRFDILFVPAGYVFAIWFFIYLGQIIFTVYQARSDQQENELLNRIAPLYWVANVANNIWLILWHWEFFPLTLAAMLVILTSLIALYLQISKNGSPLSSTEKWLVKVPFSVYLGWISVATVANFSQVLFFTGWNGFGLSPVLWTLIMLAVATVLGFLMLWRENDIAYAAVLVWAFIGIGIAQAGTPAVVYGSRIGAGLLALYGVYLIIKKK
jgi:hypothetical protein